MTSFNHESTANIVQIRERCGIMTACLTDPLSQLINKIVGLSDDDPNAVGFYYETDLCGDNKCIVFLFNTYDNDPIPWIKTEYTMDLLLSSPFITKIIYYPLSTEGIDSSSSLFFRETMSYGNSTCKDVKTFFHPFVNGLEEMFRKTVLETIDVNSKEVNDKNGSYMSLLLREIDIIDKNAYMFDGRIITGYSLVNNVLFTLMGIKHGDHVKISSNVVPCPLLKKSVSFMIPHKNASESDINYVIEESRCEITKLMAVSVDLFTTNHVFRSNVLSMRFNGKRCVEIDSKSFPIALDSLFSRESELVAYVVGCLQNGIINNGILNDIIRDLGNERFKLVNQIPRYPKSVLGNYQSLPISINPREHICVMTDAMMCTFQQTQINTDPLRNLGVYISNIADSINKPGIITINLEEMITAYNNAIEGTNLPEISTYHNSHQSGSQYSRKNIISEINTFNMNNVSGNKYAMSRQAIIAIPCKEDKVLSNYEMEALLPFTADLTTGCNKVASREDSLNLRSIGKICDILGNSNIKDVEKMPSFWGSNCDISDSRFTEILDKENKVLSAGNILLQDATTADSLNPQQIQRILDILGNEGGTDAPVNSKYIQIPVYEDKENKILSTGNILGNLSMLSEEQLLDILVYIDSLRDTDGTGNTRFANFQNEITYELARRRKILKKSKHH
jgi:hypothetical protein